MPQAEELLDPAPRQDGPRNEGPRPGFEDTAWFRMDIGRRHNADPRWLLPLLCRRGHITKNEIGAIRIAANETMFEIPRAAAARFAAAVRRTADENSDSEGSVRIEAIQGSPREVARENAREGKREFAARAPGAPPARHKPKVYKAKPHHAR
jgi:ATP-dependent RNA helicase DeaD